MRTIHWLRAFWCISAIIQARLIVLIFDVEPSYDVEDTRFFNPKRFLKEMDKAAFDKAKIQFQEIIDCVHSYGIDADVSTSWFVLEDLKTGGHAWQSFFGGPTVDLPWDHIIFMTYTEWFTAAGGWIGVDKDVAHHIIFDYANKIAAIYDDKATVAIGSCMAENAESQPAYTSAQDLSDLVSAVKASGIQNLVVYDLKGFIDNTPADWFETLEKTKAVVPTAGELKTGVFDITMNGLTGVIRLYLKLKK